MLTELFPGMGFWERAKRENFFTQYVKKKPMIAKIAMMGCRDTKKQVKRNKLTT